MDCDTARQALSAILDGEEPAVGADISTVDAHLLGCAGCAAWHTKAAELRGMARSAAPEAPDLTAAVLAAVHADERARAVPSGTTARRRVLRVAVAVAAVVQLVLAVPALLDATGLGGVIGVQGAAVHSSREMASFDIAVAVGFLLAAYRPERAKAFVPVAVVLAVCLLFSSSLDVAQGFTALADETGHLVACLQAALLWALGRTGPRTGREPAPA